MVAQTDPDIDAGLKTVDRAFRIVEYIKEQNGATLGEIAAEFGLAKSTIHRHIQTLVSHGYVVSENGEYQIGLRFLDPAIHARRRPPAYKIIESKVDKLAAETGERAQFITEENGYGIHVFSAIGENGIRSESRVGKIVHLHSTSAGKCILAHLDDDRVDEILAQNGLPRLTERTITSRAELDEELATVRQRGYGFNRAERRNGMQAVGTPILNPNDEILGAISVTGPLRRMENEHGDCLPDTLLDVAEEIRLRLEYQG
ncbi:IclR family transcriptional regulator [Halorarius halobius]|uniref:IclR family transcriptional regulator n=1 Tax=Halorarius halobius TaxID=2962671 RepID=UPI0020CE1C90|nr:IclR family transcriptional regulator [Halorarius halobius]